MKATTLVARISTLEISKNSIAYKVVSELAGISENKVYTRGGNKIRPCFVSGSGRHIHNADHTEAICQALDALKLKYEVGNDAPRGGKCGTYIQVLTKIEQ